MTHWRRLAACLAAATAIAGATADAHASTDRTLQRLKDTPRARQVSANEFRFADGVRVTLSRRAGSLCGPRTFCVWADAGYRGIQASFPRCKNNRPKSYRLSTYGLPPRKPGWLSGVTSWRNNMGRGYSAQFLDSQALPLLRVNRGGGGHMPRSKNDRAAWVDLLCVP
ncbi:MAG TPA: hypothetical protein VFZ00_28840 [Solirubrobacter sp.]|jgi:hypothetical protein|nr:hypothetical protein [Solirubrobacter sp.]